MSSIRSHFFAFSAGLSTALALLVITTRVSIDAPLLLRQNGISLAVVQGVYVVLLLAACGLWRCELRLRPVLQTRRWRVGLVVVAGVVASMMVCLVPPNQVTRLIDMPFSLWVIIMHGVGLCVLAAACVVRAPLDAPEQQTTRIAAAVLLALCVIMLVLHIASLGRYMQLDLPDEPWLSGPAANYALTGQFTSPQLAWTYGITDPVLQRFYLAMGWWLRLVSSTSLVALRSFSLLVGGVALLIFAAMLWRLKNLNRVQKLAGLATMLGLTVFVRTSHNLRADVVLVVYGTLLLWGLLRWFERPATANKRWLVLMGLALFVGMEGVPTVALVFASLVGLFVCFGERQGGAERPLNGYQALRGRFQLLPLIWYAAACLIALLVYAAIRFLPDVNAGLRHYWQFVQYYADIGLIGLRSPLDRLLGYDLRFNFILSPVEAAGLAVACVLLWRSGSGAERRISVMVLCAAVLMLTLFTASYGYWAVMTPFAGYAVARALRNRLTVVVGTFVLLPALLAAPIHDLTTAIQTNPNQPMIEGADLMTGQFPPGTRIVGDELFWFTLHPAHTFIGWWGFDRFNDIWGLALRDGLTALNIDAVICAEDDSLHFAALIQTGLFEPPTEFYIKRKGYWLFWRRV